MALRKIAMRLAGTGAGADVLSSIGNVIEFEVEQWHVRIDYDAEPTITMKMRT